MKNTRGKLVGGVRRTLGLPFVFLLCIFFFLAGFFGSSLFSQQVRVLFYYLACVCVVFVKSFCFVIVKDEGILRARSRMLESGDTWGDFDPLPHGETGEDSLSLIPFQVCFWCSIGCLFCTFLNNLGFIFCFFFLKPFVYLLS